MRKITAIAVALGFLTSVSLPAFATPTVNGVVKSDELSAAKKKKKKDSMEKKSSLGATDLSAAKKKKKKDTMEKKSSLGATDLSAVKKKKKKDSMEKKSSLGATDLSAAKKKKKKDRWRRSPASARPISPLPRRKRSSQRRSPRSFIASRLDRDLKFRLLHEAAGRKVRPFFCRPTLTHSESIALLRKRRRRPARYRPAAPLPAWQCQDTP